jgi:2-methoxy-6-polyprenyl-1,4-benzoquinol methylase
MKIRCYSIKPSTTHFGFKEIPTIEKQSRVSSVFSSVASSYDRMNDLMSFGIHRLWKNHFVSQLDPFSNGNYLDVAGGTGDIAFRIKSKAPNAKVTVLDLNPDMLQVGSQRSIEKGLREIEFVQGNAELLESIESESKDAYTIAFGIRNCTHIDKVLTEAYRVLKPGGRFMCLEFSHVNTPVLKQVYDLYSFQVIPKMGKAVANDEDSYQYLVESIRQFPTQSEFASLIKNAGFKHVTWENLNFGIAAIHSGYKF